MKSFAGYQLLSQIYDSKNTAVYRALRQQDHVPVILKTPRPGSAVAAAADLALARYRQEYEILQHLQAAGVAGVIAPIELTIHRRLPVLVLEDCGSRSLQDVLRGGESLSWLDGVAIASQLADILAQVHGAGVIHKDLNPANVLINRATGQVKLIDFGIATRFRRESPQLVNPRVLEGTLAYLSPEQTGRTSCALDCRSDLYALGVTFYELLTGQLPFAIADPLDLVHSHLARQPPWPVVPGMPEVLGQMVLKLLAKSPAERYQSAAGLRADLQKCEHRWQLHRAIEPFPLAQDDFVDHLVIPDKLYGRSAAIRQLHGAFERVLGAGNQALAPGLTLVLGPGGMGKSALVQQIHGPLSGAGGHFAAGKFDPRQRHIPYAAIAEALQGLVRQLFSESAASLDRWRQRLTTALGSNGQIALDLVPELQEIIGPQPPIAPLPPTEALNRFHLVLQHLLGAFCDPQHPLVLFLDDLQWADAASLKLLHQLLAAEPRAGFLALAAYRDDEVAPTDPLAIALEQLRQAGVQITEIHLQPLTIADISQFLTDAIGQEVVGGADLVNLIAQKSGGNPFFVTELVKALHQRGAIAFDRQRRCWQAQLTDAAAWTLPDTVVGLALAKFQELPAASQSVLQWAACLGHTFDLSWVAAATAQPIPALVNQLAAAIAAGFVLPYGSLTATGLILEHQFAHDRLQQAAYESLAEPERSQHHWQLGQLLLRQAPAASPATATPTIFAIADHLNAGLACLENPDQAWQIIRINLQAGQEARAAAAYDAAARYLQLGLSVLPDQAWAIDYDLTLRLHQATVEALYLTGQYHQAERLAALVLTQARSLMDQLPVYQTEIQFLAIQNQMAAAIELGLQVLDRLTMPLRDQPPALPDLAHFDQLPTLSDPQAQAALDICLNLFSPMYLTQPDRLGPLNWTMLDICLRYGNSAQAAFVYASYGVMLGANLGQMDLGYAFGQLALRVLERFPNRALECKVRELFHAFMQHWAEPVDQALVALRDTIQVGLDTGDLEFAGYTALHYGSNLFLSGQPLGTVAQEQAAYIDLLTKLNQTFASDYARLWGQVTQNWQGQTPNPMILNGIYGQAADWQARWHSQQNGGGLFSLYLNQGLLAYGFGDPAGAIAAFRRAQPYGGSLAGLLPSQQLPFYEALAYLALPSAARPPGAIEQVRAHQQTLAQWAQLGTANFQHKWELVTAELARDHGDWLLAEEAYERAIQGASEQGYLQEEALAWELAGRFYRDRGRERIAQAYLQSAYETYARWGAEAKLAHLEAHYPHDWFANSNPHGYATTVIADSVDPIRKTAPTTNSVRRGRSSLDLSALVQAAEAIAQEIDLDRLLDRLMWILLASAGAQSGRLLLPQSTGGWFVAARGTVEATEGAIAATEGDPSADGPTQPQVQVLSQESTTPDWQREIPTSIIYYVSRSREPVVIEDATTDKTLVADPYWLKAPVRSVLCYPLMNGGELAGLVYLENNLAVGAFTKDRLELLQLLSGQAAIALANARLYRQLRDNEQRLGQFLEAIPLGVFVTNAEGRPYYVNQAAIQMLGQGAMPGVNPDQLSIAYRVYMTDSPQLYPSDRMPIMRALAGESSRVDDLDIEQSNGQRIPLEVWGKPIVDQSNRICYAISVFQDISDRRQAEAQRLAFAENLATLNQSYARFVPQEFLEFLQKESITDVRLNDQVQQEMSVLFADIRNLVVPVR